MERILGLPNRPGIYMIKNIKTGQSYIGSATVLANRVNAHRCCLLNNKHTNKKLQRSFNKYKNCFIVGVIQFCSVNNLIILEQEMVKLYKPFFNIRKVVENNKGVKLSAETKKKMSVSHKGKPIHRNSLSALIESNKKRAGNQTDKTKAALMLGPLSNIGKPKSDKTKELIRLSKIGKKFNKTTRKYASNKPV